MPALVNQINNKNRSLTSPSTNRPLPQLASGSSRPRCRHCSVSSTAAGSKGGGVALAPAPVPINGRRRAQCRCHGSTPQDRYQDGSLDPCALRHGFALQRHGSVPYRHDVHRRELVERALKGGERKNGGRHSAGLHEREDGGRQGAEPE